MAEMFRRMMAGVFLIPLITGIARAGSNASDSAIRNELQQVYERPEFRSGREDPWINFFKSFAKLFSWLGELHGTEPALFWLILIGCIALLALIVGHISWTIVHAIHVGRRQGATSPADERRRLSAGYRSEAETRAAEGDFTSAVRFLFLSLVYAFDEAGRVSFSPATTNREYLRFFNDRPVIANNLRVFVDLLDTNWYGQRPTAKNEYEDCRVLYDNVQKQR